jgi:NAD(P)-dependent dehydrogenase (short-subunit alcohol dehydrogenase family)
MNIPIKSESIAAARALSGRVSLVTGSTSGIGLGIARAFAAAGSRFATVEKLGPLAAFLASDAAASITGTALPVDGGWTAH